MTPFDTQIRMCLDKGLFMELATKTEKFGRMTLRIDASILARLDEYHKKTEISKTRIINRALQNYFDELEEDFLDAQTGEEAWKEFVSSDKKTYSLEEMRANHGL